MLAAHFLLQYTFSELNVLYCVCVPMSAECVCYGLTSRGYVRKIKCSVSHSVGFLSHLNSSSRVHRSIKFHGNSNKDDK